MSAQKPDNPALFTDPCSPSAALCKPITLRDWFAGQALAGRNVSPRAYQYWSDLAKDCYEQADAMLAAREAKQ